MNRTAVRLSLAAAAVFASMGLAAAQTPDPHHAGAPAAAMPTMPPQAGMPMPGTGGQAASPMGGDMGRMMEMMRPMMPGGMASGMGMPFEHVEGRIAYLKAELQITDAQMTPWNAFAANIRTDAAAMRTMQGEMMKGGMSPTVLERMALIHKIMSARLALMDHSGLSINALYKALTPDQRKSFDQMMSGPIGMM